MATEHKQRVSVHSPGQRRVLRVPQQPRERKDAAAARFRRVVRRTPEGALDDVIRLPDLRGRSPAARGAAPPPPPAPDRAGGPAEHPQPAPKPAARKPVTRTEADARARLWADRARLSSRRYRLQQCVGEGSTGVVYRATDRLLDIPVAVKILAARYTRDRGAVDSFVEEARLTVRLAHRHIVRLHNIEQVRGTHFLIMEYVDGESMHAVLNRRGPLPASVVNSVVEVSALALGYAHDHGILHNDLKPEHLMLSTEGVLKLIDFGIACPRERQKERDYIVGTPAYMSPEQKRGEELDPRADVYAMGIVVYQLLTGRLPYPPGLDTDLILERSRDAFEGLEPGLLAVLERAAAEAREERWPSIADFAGAFMEAAGS